MKVSEASHDSFAREQRYWVEVNQSAVIGGIKQGSYFIAVRASFRPANLVTQPAQAFFVAIGGHATSQGIRCLGSRQLVMLRWIETTSWHVFGKFPTIPTLCSKGYQCRQTLVPGGAEGDDGLMACLPRLDTVLQIPTYHPRSWWSVRAHRDGHY